MFHLCFIFAEGGEMLRAPAKNMRKVAIVMMQRHDMIFAASDLGVAAHFCKRVTTHVQRCPGSGAVSSDPVVPGRPGRSGQSRRPPRGAWDLVAQVYAGTAGASGFGKADRAASGR